MGKLSVFDRLAIGIIICVAFIQAAQQALKDAPTLTSALPFLDLSGRWNYVPLLLLVIGAGLWVIGRLNPVAPAISDVAVSNQRPATAQKIVQTSPESEEISVQAERVFLNPNTTPENMVSVYHNRTEHEGRKLAAIYIGKWMRVKGKFSNLKNIYGDSFYLDFKDDRFDIEFTYSTLSILFDGSRWLNRLEVIPIGTEIILEGKVSHVNRSHVTLEDCELLPLDSGLPAVKIGYKEPAKSPPRRKSSASKPVTKASVRARSTTPKAKPTT